MRASPTQGDTQVVAKFKTTRWPLHKQQLTEKEMRARLRALFDCGYIKPLPKSARQQHHLRRLAWKRARRDPHLDRMRSYSQEEYELYSPGLEPPQ